MYYVYIFILYYLGFKWDSKANMYFDKRENAWIKGQGGHVSI